MKLKTLLPFIIAILLGGVTYTLGAAVGITECGGATYCVRDGVIRAYTAMFGESLSVTGTADSSQIEAVGNYPILVNGDYYPAVGCVPSTCEWLGFLASANVNSIDSSRSYWWISGQNLIPNVSVGSEPLPYFEGMYIGPTVAANNSSITNLHGLDIDLRGAITGTITTLRGLLIAGTDQAGGTVEGIINNLPGHTIIGKSTQAVTNAPKPSLVFEPVTFANLPASVNGVIAYCSNCTIANPCASGGSGAFAKRLNGVWVCN